MSFEQARLVYVVGLVIASVLSPFVCGVLDWELDGDGVFGVIAFIALWPLTVALVVLAALVSALHELGRAVRRRIKS